MYDKYLIFIYTGFVHICQGIFPKCTAGIPFSEKQWIEKRGKSGEYLGELSKMH